MKMTNRNVPELELDLDDDGTSTLSPPPEEFVQSAANLDWESVDEMSVTEVFPDFPDAYDQGPALAVAAKQQNAKKKSEEEEKRQNDDLSEEDIEQFKKDHHKKGLADSDDEMPANTNLWSPPL